MPSTSTTKSVVCGLSFSRSQPDFEGFLRALRFPPSSKLTPSLFQFDRMQDLPENHFRVSGASWVNIIHSFKVMSGVHKSKIKDEIKVREDKPRLVNQRCVVYHFKCWLYVPKPTITNGGTPRIGSRKPSHRATLFGTRRHRAKF